jgi:nuclear GTP-binding protein
MERKDHSKKAYQQELKQVLENSDVILEVLDARDPLSCRSKELESQILSHKDQKKLILILNKVDLVPL